MKRIYSIHICMLWTQKTERELKLIWNDMCQFKLSFKIHMYKKVVWSQHEIRDFIINYG